MHVRYELASVYDWSWPVEAFDVVAAIFVQFADPPMRRFMFERMARALKPGGLVLIEGYTPKQRRGFEVLELREYDTSAVIDFVALKP